MAEISETSDITQISDMAKNFEIFDIHTEHVCAANHMLWYFIIIWWLTAKLIQSLCYFEKEFTFYWDLWDIWRP